MTAPLPDSWADEPWPLDDPVPAPGLRPTNWSDTHTDPPQVAELADEAWQYAVDHGVSMEQALAHLQREAHYLAEMDRQIIHGSTYRSAMGLATGGPIKVAHTIPISQTLLDDLLGDLWGGRTRQVVGPDLSAVQYAAQEAADRQKGDQALADVKRATIVPSYKWEPDQ